MRALAADSLMLEPQTAKDADEMFVVLGDRRSTSTRTSRQHPSNGCARASRRRVPRSAAAQLWLNGSSESWRGLINMSGHQHSDGSATIATNSERALGSRARPPGRRRHARQVAGIPSRRSAVAKRENWRSLRLLNNSASRHNAELYARRGVDPARCSWSAKADCPSSRRADVRRRSPATSVHCRRRRLARTSAMSRGPPRANTERAARGYSAASMNSLPPLT
jgi:hypothetical protein